MKFCPLCGTTFEPDARFCLECGFDKSSAEAPESVDVSTPKANDAPPVSTSENKSVCPQCSTPLAGGDRFCLECGFDTSTIKPAEVKADQPIQPAVVDEIEEQAEIPESTPVSSAEAKLFCSNCGAPMVPDDVFCQECGSRTDAAVQQTPVAAPVIRQPEPVVPEKPVAETKAAVPPPPPVVKQKPAVQSAAKANPAVAEKPKSKKGLMIILFGILAIAVIGAGGWFAYDKFLKNPAVPAVDSTTMAMQAEPLAAEPEMTDTSNAVIQPISETQLAETQTQQTTPKKSAVKKKAAEPKKTEPQNQEPVKKDEPVKVKIKPVASKTGSIILSIYNDKEVKSGPLFASKLKLDKPFIITKITTYHYNWGKGATPGTISLEKRRDTKGPWQARGVAGDDGTPNGKWVCEPNERLEDGNYKVIVSDEKSWSYNGQSGQKGFVIIEGYEAD